MAQPKDIIEQGEYGRHRWEICLWPKQWKAFSLSATFAWTVVPLDNAKKLTIPSGPGIYTLLVQPGIASHPAASFLMYVGQAKNLRVRFKQYLTTEEKIRPKVVRLLNTCKGHVYFGYCKFSLKRLDPVELALLEAFNPPCNSKIPGEVGKARRAFA
jgi:hypothetical protein